MDAKEFIDSLFEGYEQTAALADFKEELLANLNAKIDSFVKKGMDAEAAFAKASSELGDVSALADELSQRKRKEVFEEVYMDIKTYLPPRRVVAYSIFSVVALFGIAVSLMAFFGMNGLDLRLRLCGFIGSMMPFITAAAAGFTFLAVTQETPSLLPVSGKRGAVYTVAAALIVFGFFVMPLAFFGSRFGLEAAGKAIQMSSEYGYEYFGWDKVIIEEVGEIIQKPVAGIVSVIAFIAPIIPFVLPGIGILVYLILTEKNKFKPWAKNFGSMAAGREKDMFNNPAIATRFGIFSGAIWMFAIGLFFLLGYLISFKYAWLVFVFAVAAQLVMQGVMSRGANNK